MRLVLALVLSLGILMTPTTARAAGTEPTGDEQALAQRYAPVVRLVHQAEPCGPGEPYQPSDVDRIMDRSDVALRGPWDTDDLIEVGPSAADLSAGLEGYHLDLPGNPLKPGCDYEKWADKVFRGSQPTVYAHVASEAGVADRLALQYWFYYPFNDYNNKHESDWESIQLLFAASSASEALGQDPIEIGYSQHEGSEVAPWGDEKVQVVDDTHPVVYPAAGSHANYYDAALYLGRSGQQGFGCDDTRGPSDELRPAVVVIPSDAQAAAAAEPWVAYRGRWGQREEAFYNGPTGPITKGTWTRPVSAQAERAHDRSFAVPAGGLFGTQATDLFCSGVAQGSDVVRLIADSPGSLLLIGALLLVVVIALVRRTDWAPTAPLRVPRRRATGQIIAAAGRLYWRRRGLFASLGVPVLVAGLAVSAIQAVIVDVPAGIDEGGEAGGTRVLLSALIGFLVLGCTVILVLGATTRAVVEIDGGGHPGVRGVYRDSLHRWRRQLGAFLLASLVVGLLTLSVVLSLVAVVLMLLLALYVPIIEIEGLGPVPALIRSARLVRHGWVKVAVLLAATIAVAVAVGPLLGLALILATGAPFVLANAVAGVTFAFLMPYVGIAMTYVFHDVRIRANRRGDRPELLPAEA
jgi:hypothetical protein